MRKLPQSILMFGSVDVCTLLNTLIMDFEDIFKEMDGKSEMFWNKILSIVKNESEDKKWSKRICAPTGYLWMDLFFSLDRIVFDYRAKDCNEEYCGGDDEDRVFSIMCHKEKFDSILFTDQELMKLQTESNKHTLPPSDNHEDVECRILTQ